MSHSEYELNRRPESNVDRTRAAAQALRPSGRIDFEEAKRAALAVLPILLARWLPGGRVEGAEYVALNPTRNDRSPGSFKIRIAGSRAGRWADFATGDSGGDPIALAAYLFQLSQNQAAKKIAHMLGVRDV
jgi:hypothetical protein